ncbi:GTP 3',8-cyclase MoaA [Pollutimonas sp. H1-120]|uniref:GTP 3',8-cyclase MoaA n=1 Tax=Pollutimonas sp. H1-120 TaxID=3148824 RepID=UPI003B51A878
MPMSAAVGDDMTIEESILLDQHARPLRDLRISVTDRCNFRCTYCMPRTVFGADFQFLPRSELLTHEEIERAARIFVDLGVRKIRITGGEPLLRKNVDALAAKLVALTTPDGHPVDVSLTTNGVLLTRKAQSLAQAGVKRLNVSLDAIDNAVFQRLTDADWSVDDVLQGIDAAKCAGIAPIKINMVVKRGINDDQVLPMAKYFRGTGHILRFIEFMDVGNTNQWNRNAVYPSSEIIALLQQHFPLEPVSPSAKGEVAKRWRYLDGQGEIGVISSVTQPFCGDCSRARLASNGGFYLCLFGQQSVDLRTLLRESDDDELLRETITSTWARRADRYSEVRGHVPVTYMRRVEMSHIGG